MHILKQSDSTAARRRILIYLVDSTDGVTEKTGKTASAGDIKISKNGAATANHSGTFTEISLGLYYYEFASAELDTLGFLSFHFVQSGVRAFVKECQIVPWDIYDSLDDDVAAIRAVTDTLTTAGIADGLLDRADAIETGLTPRGALRLIAAEACGQVSQAESLALPTLFKNAHANTKTRITATVDKFGNRTTVTTDPT